METNRAAVESDAGWEIRVEGSLHLLMIMIPCKGREIWHFKVQVYHHRRIWHSNPPHHVQHSTQALKPLTKITNGHVYTHKRVWMNIQFLSMWKRSTLDGPRLQWMMGMKRSFCKEQMLQSIQRRDSLQRVECQHFLSRQRKIKSHNHIFRDHLSCFNNPDKNCNCISVILS